MNQGKDLRSGVIIFSNVSLQYYRGLMELTPERGLGCSPITFNEKMMRELYENCKEMDALTFGN